MGTRSTLLSGFLVSVLAVCLAGHALAELMEGLFPEGVPGYDGQPGVTVQTRLHPEQMPLGLREGMFLFSPRLDIGTGYSSNVQPGRSRRGSWEVITAPSMRVGSDWSRDAFSAVVSVQDTRYLAAPVQNRTDVATSVGGRIDVGRDTLTLAAAHIAQHEDRSRLDSIASDRPIAFQLDDIRASYAVTGGRWTIEPAVQATNWTFSDTTIAGLPASQAYRDRLVTQAGATLRYEWAPLRNIVFVVRALDQTYLHTRAAQPNLDSIGYQVLAGIDYDDDAVWRWRFLVGGEARRFASRQFPQQNTLIAEAGVSWAPTGMTTVNATVSRDTEDAAQESVSGLTHSAANLTIHHEYLRDLILRASFGLQRADFFQGGHQSGFSAGMGLTWVMNRSARLSFTYDQIELQGARTPVSFATGYSRGLGLITLRLDL